MESETAEHVRHHDCLFVGYKAARTRFTMFTLHDILFTFEGNWSDEKYESVLNRVENAKSWFVIFYEVFEKMIGSWR
jgi:hypothetical protein